MGEIKLEDVVAWWDRRRLYLRQNISVPSESAGSMVSVAFQPKIIFLKKFQSKIIVRTLALNCTLGIVGCSALAQVTF